MFKAKEGNRIRLLKDADQFGCSISANYKKGEEIIALVEGFENCETIRASRIGRDGYNKAGIISDYTLIPESDYELVEQKFEIGKWYKFNTFSIGTSFQIGKVIECDEYLKCEPWIVNSNDLSNSSGCWEIKNLKQIEELKVEDECIQKYLPDGHIDKISKKEDLGNTTSLNTKFRVGDVVYIDCPLDTLGEGDSFKHSGPYLIELISDTCVLRLSGINCTLSFKRFRKATTQEVSELNTTPKYVECILSPTQWIKKGQICKTKVEETKFFWLMEGEHANGNKGCWDTWGNSWGSERVLVHFKPSTLEAYEAQSKSKESLVGRKIKALRDFPNGGAVTNQEIGIIIEDIPSKDLIANFPSQKDYYICRENLKIAGYYELMPIGWEPDKKRRFIKKKKKLAKQNYPIGTKFITIYGGTKELIVTDTNYLFSKNSDNYDIISVSTNKGSGTVIKNGAEIWSEEKGWAKITSIKEELDQEAVCNHCKDTFYDECVNSGPHNLCEGRHCKEATESYLEDNLLYDLDIPAAKYEHTVDASPWSIGIDPYRKIETFPLTAKECFVKSKLEFDEQQFLNKEYNKEFKLNIKQKSKTQLKLKL